MAGITTPTSSGIADSLVHGLRGNATNLTQDGINVADNFVKTSAFFSLSAPTVDTVGEFNVSVGGVGVDAGFGAAQVNLRTQRGTNDFHGSAFWFQRTNALNANTFFNNSSGVARPYQLQNRIGISGGGPAYIPWLYNGKNKTFIFGAFTTNFTQDGMTLYQLASTGNTGLFSVLTNSTPTGIFSTSSNPKPAAPVAAFPVSQRNNFISANTSNVWYFNRDLTTPYVLEWNLAVQRELWKRFTFEVRYVGNHAVKAYRAWSINEIDFQNNGLLTEFVNAQKNLTANQAGGKGSTFKTANGVYWLNPSSGLMTVGGSTSRAVMCQAGQTTPCFDHPGVNENGNLPYFSLDSPSFFNQDLSIIKRTRVNALREGFNFEIRIEMFNAGMLRTHLTHTGFKFLLSLRRNLQLGHRTCSNLGDVHRSATAQGT